MSTDVDPGKPVVLVSGDFLLESIKPTVGHSCLLRTVIMARNGQALGLAESTSSFCRFFKFLNPK